MALQESMAAAKEKEASVMKQMLELTKNSSQATSDQVNAIQQKASDLERDLEKANLTIENGKLREEIAK